MSNREIILDIGIGKGGAYIKNDPKNVLRIGLDLDEYGSFESLGQDFQVPGVVADSSGERGSLPFSSESFGHIDLIFPHEGLLWGLCYSDFLWQEFGRVLKKSGGVSIVTDVPYGGQGVFIDHKPKIISYSDEKIASAGERNGFLMRTQQLTQDQVMAYGTEFAEMIAPWQHIFPPTYVYLLEGKKQQQR